MKRNHLNIESTEDFKALENYFNSLSEPDGLMLLIRNPQFEFDLNLSSRMLNYHESNGFIRFHREGQAGKRRFSLVNAIGFQFSLYLKRIGLSNDEISDLNELLNSKDENGISDWDLVVYLGALAIGQFEVWLRKESNPIPINENKIKVESNGENDDFQLSNELRGTFFNGQGNILLRGKSASFLPNLIYQVDKVRKNLGWDQLSSDNFTLIQEFGEEKAEKFIDSEDVMVLNQLPITEYTKMYDIIHRDDKGNHFGIEIKFLKINPKTKFRSDKLTSNIEELKQAIQDELRFFQKMREKLNKGN